MRRQRRTGCAHERDEADSEAAGNPVQETVAEARNFGHIAAPDGQRLNGERNVNYITFGV